MKMFSERILFHASIYETLQIFCHEIWKIQEGLLI